MSHPSIDLSNAKRRAPADIVVAQPIELETLTHLEQCASTRMNAGPEPFDVEQLVTECRQARALMAFMTERVDEALLSQCPNLKIIAGALKGFDNIDVDACSRRGIAVTIVPDLLTEPTAELAIALMIDVARHIRSADQHVRAGQFAGWRPTYFGRSIMDSTIGIVGAGKVGQAIMQMLTGFRCTRLYYDTEPLAPNLESQLGATFASLSEVQSKADFLVLALPLTEETLGLVNDSFIANMKPESFLINPARGSLVVESAVADALERGQLAGYGADVFECEDWARRDRPSSIEPRLLNAQNTILTPHIGSAVTSVRRAIVSSAADSIVTLLGGAIPTTTINPDAIKAPGSAS
ncbi:MAG: NAD(P)-dependent oxidoreductase [Burkholderiaceae bacterium]